MATEAERGAKGALFAQCIKELTLNDLIDVLCLKATMTGQDVRIKVTPFRPTEAQKRGPDAGVKGYDY
jgi:hypothetical protein